MGSKTLIHNYKKIKCTVTVNVTRTSPVQVESDRRQVLLKLTLNIVGRI